MVSAVFAVVKYQFGVTATPPIKPWPYATFAEYSGVCDQRNQRNNHNVYKTELTLESIRSIRATQCINAGARADCGVLYLSCPSGACGGEWVGVVQEVAGCGERCGLTKLAKFRLVGRLSHY